MIYYTPFFAILASNFTDLPAKLTNFNQNKSNYRIKNRFPHISAYIFLTISK